MEFNSEPNQDGLARKNTGDVPPRDYQDPRPPRAPISIPERPYIRRPRKRAPRSRSRRNESRSRGPRSPVSMERTPHERDRRYSSDVEIIGSPLDENPPPIVDLEPERLRDADIIVRDYADVVTNVEERLAWLENKVRRLEGRETPLVNPADAYKRKPAVPKLNRAPWSEFKHRIAGQWIVYAIDVLEGPARYWYQFKDDESRRKRFLSAEKGVLVDDNKSADELDHAYPREMPSRISINSLPVQHILEEIIPNVSKNGPPPTMLRPYKALVRYEKQIREVFEELAKKWAELDTRSESAPPGDAQVSEETKSKADGDAENAGSVEKPEDLSDSLEAYRDLRCLIEFIDQDIRPTIDYFTSGSASKVRFLDLWFLFTPGELVYEPMKHKTEQKTVREAQPESGGKAEQAQRTQTIYKFTRSVGARPFLNGGHDKNPPTTLRDKYDFFGLALYYIDFQGADFGPLLRVATIWPFEGLVDITSLDVYPLKYAPDSAQIQERLVERGHKYRSLTVVRHMEYNGPTYSHGVLGDATNSEKGYEKPKQHENVQARVVVDVKTAYIQTQWHHYIRQVPIDLAEEPRTMNEDYQGFIWKDRDMTEKDDIPLLVSKILNDDFVDKNIRTDYISKDPFLKRWSEAGERKPFGADDLTDDLLVLLPNLIPGYVLRNREFVMLNIEHLLEIRPDLDGFNNLQLRAGQKEMVQALVNTHFRDRAAILNQKPDKKRNEYIPDVDIVEGKGKGLVILLHGAPGVGKTSTAECVAESSRKPLLPIICGDLGITAAEVEKSLEQKFELAEKWNCVLLLDEADVFLAQRTKSDLKRNALVSVFLRVLEYYTGILFLTTNRVGAFDEAFRSRIHMTLYYPLLDEDQTKRIWSMNLKRMLKRKEGKLEASERELLEFALMHFKKNVPRKTRWNGRQIRNAFQTAAALAEFEAHNQPPAPESVGDAANAGESPPVVAKLQVKHFEIVAEAALQFDTYIEETIAYNQSDRAYQAKERSDHFDWKQRSSTTRPPAQMFTSSYGAASDYDPNPPYYASRQDAPWSSHTPGRERSYGYDRDAEGYDRRTPGSGLSERMQDSAMGLATPNASRRSPGPPHLGAYDGTPSQRERERGPYSSAPPDEPPPFATYQRGNYGGAGYEGGRYQRGETEPPSMPQREQYGQAPGDLRDFRGYSS